MANLSVPLNDVFLIAGVSLFVALLFLMIGYAMGRSAKGDPVQITGKIANALVTPKAPAPFHDNAPDMFEEALRGEPEPNKRISTV